jgi:hypothetical protein
MFKKRKQQQRYELDGIINGNGVPSPVCATDRQTNKAFSMRKRTE